MRPFTLHIPTKFVVGTGMIERAGKEAARIGRKAMIVCSSGSAVRTGILERLAGLLEAAGVQADVYDRVTPNPKVSMVDRGGELARDLKSDLIIGLGGGSAMDSAKGIAITAANGGSAWDYVHVNKTARRSLPVMAVPTLSATGSEGNAYGVVTHDETLDKAGFICYAARPRTAVIDPELTLSVPVNYIKDGAVDIITHALESYFTSRDTAPLNDKLSLALARSAADTVLGILDDPENLSYRDTFAWTSTLALSDLNDAGREGPYIVHALEHPLSGLYGISHGMGLAVLLPRYLRYFMPLLSRRILGLGRAFGYCGNDPETALETFCLFMESLGRRMTLQEAGIPNPDIEALTDSVFRLNANRQGLVFGPRSMNRQDVMKIYSMCTKKL